jgi:hypothetical protein
MNAEVVGRFLSSDFGLCDMFSPFVILCPSSRHIEHFMLSCVSRASAWVWLKCEILNGRQSRHQIQAARIESQSARGMIFARLRQLRATILLARKVIECFCSRENGSSLQYASSSFPDANLNPNHHASCCSNIAYCYPSRCYFAPN